MKTYDVRHDEYNGHPIIQFWAEDNNGRFPNLSFGLPKARVILNIVDSSELTAAVREFLVEHETPAVS